MKNIKVALLKDDNRVQEIFEYIISLFDILTNGQMNYIWTDFGKAAYEKEGDVLPPSAITAIKQSGAALMGLIDKSGASYGSPVGKMRKNLGLYADIRPVHSFNAAAPFDMVFIRESTEGFLADRNCFAGMPEFMPTEDVALSVRVISRKASMKIARYAFEYAVKNGRKAILAAHKSNVLTLTCKLFLECFYETAREYPNIKVSDDYADNVANGLIIHPETYDVILTTNLFGDILSDEGSALCGNLCAACNLSDEAAVYMPVSHIAPRDEQNLIRFFYPYLLCTARILADSGYTEQSSRLVKAVTDNFDLSLGVTEAGRNIKEAVLQ